MSDEGRIIASYGAAFIFVIFLYSSEIKKLILEFKLNVFRRARGRIVLKNKMNKGIDSYLSSLQDVYSKRTSLKDEKHEMLPKVEISIPSFATPGQKFEIKGSELFIVSPN